MMKNGVYFIVIALFVAELIYTEKVFGDIPSFVMLHYFVSTM